jgi:hypothetical protein
LPWTSIVESVAALLSEDAIADSMNAQSIHVPKGLPFRNGQTRHRVNTPPVLWGLEPGGESIMTLDTEQGIPAARRVHGERKAPLER